MNNFIKSHFKNISFNDVLVFMFIGLIAVIFANTLLNNPGMSITPWFKMLFTIGGACLVIALLKGSDTLQIFVKSLFERPSLSIKTLIWVASLSLLAGLVLCNTEFYELIWMFIIAVLGLFSFSIYFMLSARAVDSICLYILSWPFVFFAENRIESFVVDRLNLSFSWIDINICFLLLLSFTWFIKYKFIDKNSFRKARLNKYIFIFIGLAFISVLFSEDFVFSIRAYLFSVIYPVLIYFMIISSIERKNQIKKIIMFTVLSAFLNAIFNFYYYLKYYSGILDTPDMISYHATNMSSILYLVIPLALGLLVLEKRKLWKLFYILMQCAFLTILLYTFSRAALILAGFTFLCFSLKRQARGYIISLAVIILLFGYFNFSKVTPFFRRFKTLTSVDAILSESSMSSRLKGWRAAIGMFKDHPLTGVGIGMFPEHYPEYERLVHCSHPLYKDELVPMSSAHHVVLNYLSETGLIGTIPVMLLLLIIFKRSIFVLKKSSFGILEITLFITFLVFLIHAFTAGGVLGSTRGFSMSYQVLWIIIGLIMGSSYLIKRKIHS